MEHSISKKTMRTRAKARSTKIQDDYGSILKDLRGKINTGKFNALYAVNKELISVYWEIGRTIYEKEQSASWDKRSIEQLSKDLQRSFADKIGFTVQNLWRMKDFYQTYYRSENLQLILSDISWSHHIYLLEKCNDNLEREFYILMTKRNGWGYQELLKHIENKIYELSQSINTTKNV